MKGLAASPMSLSKKKKIIIKVLLSFPCRHNIQYPQQTNPSSHGVHSELHTGPRKDTRSPKIPRRMMGSDSLSAYGTVHQTVMNC